MRCKMRTRAVYWLKASRIRAAKAWIQHHGPVFSIGRGSDGISIPVQNTTIPHMFGDLISM